MSEAELNKKCLLGPTPPPPKRTVVVVCFFYKPQIPGVNPADTERLEWIPCWHQQPAEHTSVMGGGRTYSHLSTVGGAGEHSGAGRQLAYGHC